MTEQAEQTNLQQMDTADQAQVKRDVEAWRKLEGLRWGQQILALRNDGKLLHEQAVLGSALLLKSEDIRLVGTIAEPAHFSVEVHAQMWAVLLDMAQRGVPTDDWQLFGHEMIRAGHDKWEALDWGAYYVGLSDFCIWPPNASWHAQIVREEALRRRAVSGCGEVAGLAKDPEQGVEQIGSAMVEKGESLIKDGADSHTLSMAQVMPEVWGEIMAGVDGAPRSEVMTGLQSIDAMIGGLRQGELVILAARPSVGKTALALQIAANVAQRGGAVVYYSLEMTADMLGKRLLAQEAHVDLTRVVRQTLRREDLLLVKEAGERIQEWPLHVYERMDATPEVTLAQTYKLIARKVPVKLVVVDYLQLMDTEAANPRASRQEVVAAISRSLKKIAGELEIPILGLSQLNRNVEHREDPPRLSDLRESGAIEQDADVVMFLHRTMHGEDNRGISLVDLIVAKQRNGGIGTVPLACKDNETRFMVVIPGSEEDLENRRIFKRKEAGPPV